MSTKSAAIYAAVAEAEDCLYAPLRAWVDRCDLADLTPLKVKVAEAMLHAHLVCRYPAADCFDSVAADNHADALLAQGFEPDAVHFSSEELADLAEIGTISED